MLPPNLVQDIRHNRVDLTSPATTLALLKLNSVVGLTGFFNDSGTLKSIGIQCALCHSTVDNSMAFGIGRRLDGFANHDLNVGALIEPAPDLSAVTSCSAAKPIARAATRSRYGPSRAGTCILPRK